MPLDDQNSNIQKMAIFDIFFLGRIANFSVRIMIFFSKKTEKLKIGKIVDNKSANYRAKLKLLRM